MRNLKYKESKCSRTIIIINLELLIIMINYSRMPHWQTVVRSQTPALWLEWAMLLKHPDLSHPCPESNLLVSPEALWNIQPNCQFLEFRVFSWKHFNSEDFHTLILSLGQQRVAISLLPKVFPPSLPSLHFLLLDENLGIGLVAPSAVLERVRPASKHVWLTQAPDPWPTATVGPRPGGHGRVRRHSWRSGFTTFARKRIQFLTWRES